MKPSRTCVGCLIVALPFVLSSCCGDRAREAAGAAPAGAAAAAKAPTGLSAESSTFTNPVIDADFADPAILRASDRRFYAYATQTEVNGHRMNVQVAGSVNLVRWDAPHDAMPDKPRWANQKKNQNIWAPSVLESGGVYYMYYAAEPDRSQRLCIGVATARAPGGPFVDVGAPLLCDDRFSIIDPMAFDDPKTKKRLLYFNKGLPEGRPKPLVRADDSPIAVTELAEDRVSIVPGRAPVELVHPYGERPYENLFEGAWVTVHDGTYYLFYSGDNCCEPNAHYAVMVARSGSATGPFETLAHATGRSTSAIVEQSERWLAPGHNAVVTDARGVDWLVYHAIDRTKNSVVPGTGFSRRPMLIDRVVYKDGWPSVEGGSPSAAAVERPSIDPAR